MAGPNTEIKMESREPNQNGPQINQNQSHNPVNQHNTGRGGRGGGRGGFNHGGRKFQGSPGSRRDDGRGQKNQNQDVCIHIYLFAILDVLNVSSRAGL